MKTWMIWMASQENHDLYRWLEAAWTDDQTSENPDGWRDEVDRCRKLAFENGYEMRIQEVNVPGVIELFEIPEVTAEPA